MQFTTPDGLVYYEYPRWDGGYCGAYDTNGDIDVRDAAVDESDAARNYGMKNAIRANFGIPTNSRLYDQHPDIQEFRVRKWDLDNNNDYEKIEIIINDQFVFSTTSDPDGDGVDLVDAFDAAGWRPP